MGDTEAKLSNSEPIPGPTTRQLSKMAAKHGLYIHAGSMHEAVDVGGKVGNTSVLIDDDGEIVSTYQKVHLFDVEIGDEVMAEESARSVSGDELVVAETDLATFGLSICYDLRFPELYSTLAQRGATILFVPSAFTLYTGKDHWEPLLRARAIENQAYVVAAGQIGERPEGGTTYGKSMVVDPWGTVISQASDRVGMITAEIDLDYVQEVRQNLPSLSHKRPDVYK
jgi:predicted amidohydrolase